MPTTDALQAELDELRDLFAQAEAGVPTRNRHVRLGKHYVNDHFIALDDVYG